MSQPVNGGHIRPPWMSIVPAPDPGHYRLWTTWRLRAPQQDLFDILTDSLRWPQWWPGAESVDELVAGNTQGVGSMRRYCWKSPLRYRLAFDATARRIEPPSLLEGVVDGDLSGSATCLLSHSAGVTRVDFEWDVHTVKAWMNLLAPAAHPLFALNHRLLMERGARGLSRWTGYALLSVDHRELPPTGAAGIPPSRAAP